MIKKASLNERGAAIFLALLSLSVIGYLSLRIMTLVKLYSDLFQSYSDGINNQTTTRSGITAPVTSSRDCHLQTVDGGQVSGRVLGRQDWYVCVTERPSWFSNDPSLSGFKSPDFNSIFKTAAPCAYERKISPNNTYSTPKSGYTCELPSDIVTGLTVTDNIWALGVTVTKQPPLQKTIIATPGELTIENHLTLNDNALIIAGGNIRIAAISYKESGSINVTVISAHGAVRIDNASSGVRLLILARQAISGAPSIPQTSPLLPPFRANSISGIVPR